MKTTLCELRNAYKQCPNDDSSIELNGSLFYAGYLKYLIQYLELCKAKDDDVIKLTPTLFNEEDEDGWNDETKAGGETIPEEGNPTADGKPTV